MDMKKVLEDFDAAYNKAFNQGDAAGCAAFFTEDVILLAPDQPMTRGKRAINWWNTVSRVTWPIR
ncbi:MAG: hypothetical protein WBW73_30010 [Rhodoplanes sp.]